MSAISHPEALQACLSHIGAHGPVLMEGLIDKAQTQMRSREKAFDINERNLVADAVHLLARHKAALCSKFPAQLLAVISETASPEGKVSALPELRFDELELMDDAQVQENVELARIQQAALLAAESQIAELDARLSTAQGFKSVRSDRNPFRPRAFARALRNLLYELPVSPTVRIRWLHYVGAALGTELKLVYAQLNQLLKSQGIAEAAYTVTQVVASRSLPATSGSGWRGADGSGQAAMPGSGTGSTGAPFAGQGIAAGAEAAASLTMDQLHRLVTGDFDVDASSEPGADADASGQYDLIEAPELARPRFSATVPAALEALKEMQQVELAVERLRKSRKGERRLGQRLGREVVHLMVANMVQDPRLLAPVGDAIARLEPALLQLATSDPRFFSDKAHPARLLLERITQRSLAFATADTTDFAQMMEPVERAIGELLSTPIQDHEPFAAAMGALEQTWAEQEASQRAARDQAVQALLLAEQRNLLAHKMAEDLAKRPDAVQAPAFVKDFLAGPWAQVMAQAQIHPAPGAADLQACTALVDDLLWSAHPDLIRQNRQRLIRVIPDMLPRLRAGLQAIDYPAEQASNFFSKLMHLHQEGIKPAGAGAAQRSARERLEVEFAPSDVDAPWLAPREAQNSGFLDAADTQPMTQSMVADAMDANPAYRNPADSERSNEPAADPLDLRLGSWIEFTVRGLWVRAELTWASPHGTLFMFTRASGQPYSMTRRTLDRMRESDSLRILSQPDVVAGALDAVARAALRNSVDVSL